MPFTQKGKACLSAQLVGQGRWLGAFCASLLGYLCSSVTYARATSHCEYQLISTGESKGIKTRLFLLSKSNHKSAFLSVCTEDVQTLHLSLLHANPLLACRLMQQSVESVLEYGIGLHSHNCFLFQGFTTYGRSTLKSREGESPGAWRSSTSCAISACEVFAKCMIVML